MKSILVLDSGSIFKGIQSLIHKQDMIFTTNAVMNEIKDPNSRQTLELIKYKLTIKEPSLQYYNLINVIAKNMNMNSFLSKTDKQVIALAVELQEQYQTKMNIDQEKLQNGFKLEAFFQGKKVKVFRSKNSELLDQEGEKLAEKIKNEFEEDFDEDGFAEVKSRKKITKAWVQDQAAASHDHSTISADHSIDTHSLNVDTQDNITAVDSNLDTTNMETIGETGTETETNQEEEDEGTEWINEDNFTGGPKPNTVQYTSANKIQVSTMDQTMQNMVLLIFEDQVELITLDNMLIKSAQQFAKRCYSCSWLDLSGSKDFCGECGKHTLKRVFAKVTGDTLEIHQRDKKIINKKKINIDNIPKSNVRMNYNRDLILAEDEMLYMRSKPKMKVKKEDQFEGGQETVIDKQLKYGQSGKHKRN